MALRPRPAAPARQCRPTPGCLPPCRTVIAGELLPSRSGLRRDEAACRCASKRSSAPHQRRRAKCLRQRVQLVPLFLAQAVARNRCAAAARLARRVQQLLDVARCREKELAVLGVNSSESRCVSSPRACLSNRSLRSSSIGDPPAIVVSGTASACFMPAKRWSSSPQPETVLDLLILAGLPAAPTYSASSCTALAGEAGSASSSAKKRAWHRLARAGSLRSASGSSSS